MNQALWTNDHREWYRTVYLRSEHWRELRARKLAHNPKCQRCGAKARDVHHRRYRNIFDVQLSDLESLCRKCHKAEHGRNGTPRRRKPRLPKFRISEEQRLRNLALKPLSKKERRRIGRARADRKAHALSSADKRAVLGFQIKRDVDANETGPVVNKRFLTKRREGE